MLVTRLDLLVFLVVLEALYLSGWWTLRIAAGTRIASGSVLGRQLLGFFLLLAALVSPLDAWQRRSFAAHMLQHELLMLAAPLLLSARPLPVFLWSLSPKWRGKMARLLRPGSAARRLVDAALWPWGALGLSLLVLWTWHLPVLYNAVQFNQPLHDAQHVSFFVSGLLLWWPVVRAAPYPYRWSQAEGVLYGLVGYVLTALTLRSLLGLYFTLTDQPVYAYYADRLGPLALEDQQQAGLVMWLLPLPVFVGAALSAVWREPRRRTVPRVEERVLGEVKAVGAGR